MCLNIPVQSRKCLKNSEQDYYAALILLHIRLCQCYGTLNIFTVTSDPVTKLNLQGMMILPICPGPETRLYTYAAVISFSMCQPGHAKAEYISHATEKKKKVYCSQSYRYLKVIDKENICNIAAIMTHNCFQNVLPKLFSILYTVSEETQQVLYIQYISV